MELFNNVVENVLCETKKKETFNYDSIPESDFVNGPVYVYHMTSENNLKGGILKSGWESFYNLVNSYGPGIYTTIYPSFDPRAEVKDENGNPNPTLDYDGGTSRYSARRWIYGEKDNKGGGRGKPAVMIACKTINPKPFWSFVILDEKIAKQVYRRHWRLEDQLKLILGDKLYSYAERKFGHNLIHLYNAGRRLTYERGDVAYSIDHMLCSDLMLNRKIKGIIFHGPGDGFVAIFRDYNALQPFAVSDDCGHTFRELNVEHTYEEYNNKNVDVRSALGLDRFFFVKKDTIKPEYIGRLKGVPFKYLSSVFYGDYAMVGDTDNPQIRRETIGGRPYSFITTENKNEWKWNFIYKPLINSSEDYNDILVSKNIWFDTVSEVWNKNTCLVSKDNKLYYIINKSGTFFLYDNKGMEIGDLATITDADLINAERSDSKPNEPKNEPNITDSQTVKKVRPKRIFGLKK